ncbi:MAG TPA: hypothetical protein PKA77_04760 [Chitinophagaceae bacterium]|nr:hypothetical protein [Chitinophagaceae bacterium]HMU57797.1 hypothetical protein [Chitinophagaceae bacterium]
MKKVTLYLLITTIFFASCAKDEIVPPVTEEQCIAQTSNPAGRSYSNDSVIVFNCTSKHCGIIPLSTKNYWVYEDSIFSDGVLQKVQLDTLRYSTTYKSLSDGLVWWQASMDIGLPETLYANDSTLFSISDRVFMPDVKDAKKEYGLFAGDSLRYLANFEDAAAQGRSLKISGNFKTPAGSFNDYLYFEKNARNYRKDQVYFEPGIGVLKYIQEKAPMGTRFLKLQQISTLVSYHIE